MVGLLGVCAVGTTATAYAQHTASTTNKDTWCIGIEYGYDSVEDET